MNVKLNPTHIRRVVTLAALAASIPVAMATSANAATVPLGCTVTPKTPVQVADNFWTGVNRAKFTVTVSCPAGRVVHVDQRGYETTSAGLTTLGKQGHNNVFISSGSQNDTLSVDVPNSPGSEWVMQRVQVTVYDANHIDGLVSPWISSGSTLIN
jgi:hypothetical protein